MQLTQDQFRAVVVKHQSMVYSIALRLLLDPSTAEEVAQDVFVELHGRLARIDSEEHLVSWLRRVAVHRATDARRRRHLRPEAASEHRAEPWEEAELQGLLAGWRSTTAPRMTAGLEVRLAQVLESLPIALRTAVVLRYQEEQSPSEIAALLGQPVNTVKSNLQRALALLRRKAATALKEYVRA